MNKVSGTTVSPSHIDCLGPIIECAVGDTIQPVAVSQLSPTVVTANAAGTYMTVKYVGNP